MNIHEILKQGFIVCSDAEIDVLITADVWTLKYYGQDGHGGYSYQGSKDRESLGIFSILEIDAEAKNWLNDIKTDFYEGMPTGPNEHGIDI